MMPILHISIVGLSLSITNQIKSLLQAALTSNEIHWSNIADPQLNLIIVNEAFIESAAIQKYVRKNISILSVQQHQPQQNTIIENTLYLPFDQPQQLQKWLQINILKTEISAPPKVMTHSFLSQQPIDLIELLQPLWLDDATSFYSLTLNQKDTLLIDKRKQEIWVSTDFQPQLIQNIHLEVTNFDQAVLLRQKKQKYDLRYWLWNHLWQYFPNAQLQLDTTETAKLLYWPQPKIGTSRQTLRMAACFEYGAHFIDVAKHTELPDLELKKFMTLGLACNLLKAISHKETTFLKSATIELSRSPIRGFLSKIRKKLGL